MDKQTKEQSYCPKHNFLMFKNVEGNYACGVCIYEKWMEEAKCST